MLPVKNLSIAEKAKIKRALIGSGHNPSGMSDQELIDAYEKLNAPRVAPIPPAEKDTLPDTGLDIEPEIKSEPKNPVKSRDPAEVLKLLGELLQTDSAPVLDENRIIELIKQHSSAPLSYEIKQNDKPTIKIKGAHKQFAEVLGWINSGNMPYLAGGAGVGKTTIASHIATALDLPFFFTGAIFQKYELLGYIDANGELVRTPFREAYECGGLFLFDEIDASDSGALVAFNAAIENGMCAFPDRIIKAHKDFKVISASNTKGKGATRQYTGRNPLDASTLDRYVIIEIDVDEKLELEIAQAICPKDAEEITRTIQLVRKRAIELGLDCIISPRATYQACKAVAAGIAIDQALKASLWNKLDATSIAQLGGE